MTASTLNGDSYDLEALYGAKFWHGGYLVGVINHWLKRKPCIHTTQLVFNRCSSDTWLAVDGFIQLHIIWSPRVSVILATVSQFSHCFFCSLHIPEAIPQYLLVLLAHLLFL